MENATEDDENQPLVSGRRQECNSISSSENTFLKRSSKKPFMKYVHRYFPITVWLPKYSINYAICDLIAGFTVGLTVIPQALAYAQIACLPIQYGLYSSFMGGFIYCIFGTSKDITLGPTAIMSLLVHNYGECNPIQAVILTLFAGLIQFVMGVFRLGFIMQYISIPVISGFTSAAAITIAFGQVKHILGVKTTSNDFFPELIEVFKNIETINIWDVLMGVSCIILLFLLKKIKSITASIDGEVLPRKVQWARKFLWFICTGRNAVVVICAALTAFAISTQKVAAECEVKNCLTLTGTVEEGLPDFKPPELSEITGNKTTTTGDFLSDIGVGLFVVPLMGLLESIAIGKSFAAKGDYTLDSNQEMIAIGLANVASSFVSSYSITGSFSRTAINAQSHVQTPAGGLVTGSLVLISLALLTPFFYYIPKSALAAVIISSVVTMIDYSIVLKIWKTYKLDLLPLIATFLLCFWEIPYGILAGISCSLLFVFYHVTWPKLETSNGYDGVNENTVLIKIQQGVFFCCAEYIETEVKKAVKESETEVKQVIINASNIFHLDYTTSLWIIEIAESLKKHDTNFSIASLEYSLFCFLKNVDRNNIISFHTDTADALN